MTRRQFTVAQAAAELGASHTYVRDAIHRGALKAAQLDAHRRPFIIAAQDLAAFVRTSPPPQRFKRWTPDMDAALIELLASCTHAQIAAYLGRTRTQVSMRVQALKDRGAHLPSGRGQRKVPFEITRTAILVAKSCTKCGKLRDSRYYFRMRNGFYEPSCSVCRKAAQGSDPKRKAQQEKYRENMDLLQEITYPQAHRDHWPYTAADMAVLGDLRKSDFDVAIELGRTYYAVRHQRVINTVRRAPRRRLPDSYWRIELPAAQLAVQEHFRHLGEPVPEELWDWTDEVAS